MALIMVTVRVVQRSFIKKNLGWDDCLIIAAMVCACPMNCVTFQSESGGFPMMISMHRPANTLQCRS